MEELVNFLQRVDIFSLLSTEEIMGIIPGLHFIDINEGDILFKEGEEGNTLYIVFSGKVASSLRLSHGNKREIAEYKQGEFFGEMSVFENAPRSATCYAKEKSRLISLHERDFFELILFYPDIAIKLMYRMLNIITERLEMSNNFLSDMVLWGEEARKRAITDEITGIYNRGYLDNALEDYYEKAKSAEKSMTFIMIDIDDFKQISCAYDIEKVNQVLNEVLQKYKRHLRKSDILARYGGDEFAVILRETGLNEAKTLAEKARKSVEKISFTQILDNDNIKVTISQGIASYPKNANNLNSLLREADMCLNKAKREGKNKVVCSTVNLQERK